MSNDAATIRRARMQDQEAVGGLWEAFMEEQAALDTRFVVAGDALERFYNDFSIWLQDETQCLFVAEAVVAEAGGAFLGFARAHRWGPSPIYADASEVYLDELYVAEDVRRQGVGRQLAEAVHRWAEALQADRVRLSTLAANEAGRAFWRQQGAAAFFETLTVELAPDRTEQEQKAVRRPLGFR